MIPGPEGMQRLLNFYAWDTDGVRDDVRAAVVEAIGDAEDGVLIVDETGPPEPPGSIRVRRGGSRTRRSGCSSPMPHREGGR